MMDSTDAAAPLLAAPLVSPGIIKTSKPSKKRTNLSTTLLELTVAEGVIEREINDGRGKYPRL